MKLTRTIILLLILNFLGLNFIEAQHQPRSRKELKEQQELLEEWPPKRGFSRVSLGYALQGVFKKHYEFCGFPEADGARDYTPPTLARFLGKRDLRTRVEQANLSGGNLLNYIFTTDELYVPLDVVKYQSDRLLNASQSAASLMPQPREGFDSFVLTKNCSGYLKACLDAGIKPPYAAFSTALSTDGRRESSVLALAGSFVSPLSEILAARDSRTTELMSRLWIFYQTHPEFIGKAYYLREFEGILVKHLSSAEEISKSERALGVNVSLPFSATLNASLDVGRTNTTSFVGTDWETIVYADFAGPYQRQNLYAAFPSPAQIAEYFANLRPTFSNAKDFPLLTEGAEHRHFLSLSGVPAELARQPWRIVELTQQVYQEMPRSENRFVVEPDGRFGLQFTVSGLPDARLFRGLPQERPGSVGLHYALEMDGYCGGEKLRIYIDQELATSLQPSLKVIRADFDLSKRDNRLFACQWEVEVALEDSENPIAFDQETLVSNLSVRNADQPLSVALVSSRFDYRRHVLYLVFATTQSWQLDQINDRNMINFNLSGDLHLPTQRGTERAVRPLKAIIAMPEIGRRETTVPTVVPAAEVVPIPEGGLPGGG